MSRRDISHINVGPKLDYDTWPHTRALLVCLRDLAVTEKELDEVAKIADKFDAEDQAWIAAGKVVRHLQALGNGPG